MARILVIEDDDSFREILKENLERNNYEVVSATNGDDGIRILKNNPVDLVITDIIMPARDGVTTIQDIQKGFPSVKIIAMSGGGMLNKGEGYLEAAKYITHIKHVLTKPFSSEQLFRAIKELLG